MGDRGTGPWRTPGWCGQGQGTQQTQVQVHEDGPRCSWTDRLHLLCRRVREAARSPSQSGRLLSFGCTLGPGGPSRSPPTAQGSGLPYGPRGRRGGPRRAWCGRGKPLPGLHCYLGPPPPHSAGRPALCEASGRRVHSRARGRGRKCGPGGAWGSEQRRCARGRGRAARGLRPLLPPEPPPAQHRGGTLPGPPPALRPSCPSPTPPPPAEGRAAESGTVRGLGDSTKATAPQQLGRSWFCSRSEPPGNLPPCGAPHWAACARGSVRGSVSARGSGSGSARVRVRGSGSARGRVRGSASASGRLSRERRRRRRLGNRPRSGRARPPR